MHLLSADPIDPYAYTAGRWLRHDRLECESRYIAFDFDALCRRIVELCPGAGSIASYHKTEGGFNRVFIFTTDNGKRVVARIPFKLAGPPRLTTNSEVATIKYLQAKTSIPIPRILDWSDDASDPIGTEYIIMEHAVGVQLHQRWPTMVRDQQIRCIDAIYQKVKEMVDIEFPAYGSLYLNDAPFDLGSKQLVDQDFCIGPHCGARYWNCNVGESRYYHNTTPNQGPWCNLLDYCDGLIDTGISRIPLFDSMLNNRPRYHGSVEDHLQILECSRDLLREMSRDARIQSTAAPTLLHPDLHKRNIFVSEDDPTIITNIIDWQSSSVEPAFWYADEIPDFARIIAQSAEDDPEPDSVRCAKAFDVCTQFRTPKLSNPRLMDEGLFRPFRYCYRTWRDGATAMRHELIETSAHWKELGFEGSCPYIMPSPNKLIVHQEKYKTFVAAQELRRDLSMLLDTASDGWVPQEDWEKTKAAHKEMFDGMLQAVMADASPDEDEPIKDEGDLREIWPFDI